MTTPNHIWKITNDGAAIIHTTQFEEFTLTVENYPGSRTLVTSIERDGRTFGGSHQDRFEGGVAICKRRVLEEAAQVWDRLQADRASKAADKAAVDAAGFHMFTVTVLGGEQASTDVTTLPEAATLADAHAAFAAALKAEGHGFRAILLTGISTLTGESFIIRTTLRTA